jgi:hypothetical protein
MSAQNGRKYDHYHDEMVWTKKKCRDHVHVEVIIRLKDGTCVTLLSPGLPDNLDRLTEYLDEIYKKTGLYVPYYAYKERSEIPRVISVPETPYEE